jgi:hypothetical protein
MGDSTKHPSEFLEFTTIATGASNPTSNPSRAEKPTTSDESFDSELYQNDTPMQHMPRRGSVVGNAAQTEHRMTFTQALRLYPKAIGWSFMISLAIIMEGYDTALVWDLSFVWISDA